MGAVIRSSALPRRGDIRFPPLWGGGVLTRRGFYKVARLNGGRGFAFPFLGFQKGKSNKREKETRGGISSSARKPLNLGLQVFALRRGLRASSPHQTYVWRGPHPLWTFSLTDHTGAAAPMWRTPGTPAGRWCGNWDYPRTGFVGNTAGRQERRPLQR